MSQPASIPSIPRKDIHAHRLLILDFGSQYTQLIARRVREQHVYCEIHPGDLDLDAVFDEREYVRHVPEVFARLESIGG